MKRLLTGTFWYWNGNPTPNGMRRQLESMKKAGYRCIYIHPMPDSFHKYNFFQGMEIPYLSDEYFRLMKIALAECKRLGLYMMLYDEGGWPSCGVLDRLVKEHPECKARFLKKDDKGGYNEVTGDFPDLLTPQAAQCFISMVHERYYKEMGEEFGKTIRGIFTDEPFWRCLPGGDQVRFSDEMPGLFRDLYGCSFEKDILPHIFGGTPDTLERQEARRKYIHVCSVLVKKHYSAVLAKWCEEHHLDLEGHFDNEDRFFEVTSNGEIMQFLDPLHVPGVDAIWRQIYPDSAAPGNYARLAAAAAIRNRREEALCESFNVYGYFLTPRIMAFVAGALISKGINRVLPMPYLYSDRGKRKICCGTDISPRTPIWNAMPALTGLWNWAADFSTGALQPKVWLLAYPKHPCPDAVWSPEKKHADAHNEMESLIGRLDDACVFWRFADLSDENYPDLPEVLILPFPLTDEKHRQFVKTLEKKGVKILNGWELPDLKEYSYVDIAENNRCRVLPCMRSDGEALIVFNPDAVSRTFEFTSSEKWGELLPPDPVLQEFKPMKENDGTFQLFMPPFALRILRKNIPGSPAVKLRKCTGGINWRISKVEKLSYSLYGWSRYEKIPAPSVYPAKGLYTEIDKEFSGIVTYKGEFFSDKKCTAFIEFKEICHCGSLKINGKEAGLRASAPWVFKGELKKGKNTFELVVSSSGGNEWRRCCREELRPAGFINGYDRKFKIYDIDDAECGIKGDVNIYCILPAKIK